MEVLFRRVFIYLQKFLIIFKSKWIFLIVFIIIIFIHWKEVNWGFSVIYVIMKHENMK